MAFYLVRYQRCGGCGFPLEMSLFALNSRLGPAVVRCRKCRGSIHTVRKEWADLDALARLRFAALAVLYAIVGGIAGGNCLFAAAEKWGGAASIPNLPWERGSFRLFSALYGVLVLLILAVKVLRSARAARDPERRMAEGFFSPSFTFGAHPKLLLGIILPWLLAYLMAMVTNTG
jgi:hypothetical protein